jgi:hypothetical protein
MTPCPRHPFSPLTRLGCCQCHGEELAGRNDSPKGFIPKKQRGRSNFEPLDDASEREDEPEIQHEMVQTIKGWKGQATSEWGAWKNA